MVIQINDIMQYIILAAGVGSRLYPYTKNMPKCMVKVTPTETIVERAVRLIKKNDKDAELTIVLGYQGDTIKQLLGDKCNYIVNPFYKVTNSIASLWFARKVLEKHEPTVVLNADIVFSKSLAKEICKEPEESTIYYDSSIQSNGDYNVQELNDYMIVMGKELDRYSGEYVGITKYPAHEIQFVLDEVDMMVHDDLYDQWYENALVQMSLNSTLRFKTVDISDYDWSEIDSIDNLMKIREIIKREKE